MPRRKTSLSEHIREYLSENGTAYVNELRKTYVEYCEENDYAPPSYDSVRSSVWELKQLGLIEPSHTRQTTPALQPRQYYRLAPGSESEDWSDPRGQLYPRE